jgi:hypothetical protein
MNDRPEKMRQAHFWSFQGVTEGRASCSVPVIRNKGR